jgi:hypothetical protein
MRTARFLALALVFASASVACAKPPSDAQKLKDALTGDARGASTDNPLCKLYSPRELAAYAGQPLKDGENAAMGTGCMWVSKNASGNVLLQVAPKRYHRNPIHADGYRQLPGLGVEGNVQEDMGGWVAASIVGEESMIVAISGPAASAANAEALLRDLIKRRGGKL